MVPPAEEPPAKPLGLRADPTDPPAADAALEQALAASRGLRDAPESVIARALAVWAPRQQPVAPPADVAPAGAGGAARRLWQAVLSFDSHAVLPQALGLRSTPSALRGASRQLVYNAGGLDVDVRLLPPDAQVASWRIRGQVLGPVAGGMARLQHAGGTLTASLDEWLEFRFDALPQGPCQITLDLTDRVLALPAFELDPA